MTTDRNATSGPVMGLAAGTAQVVITPPVGIPLIGFAGRGSSIGVHDDLTATALVLCERSIDGDVPESRVALVALDLLDLYDSTLIQSIKNCIAESTGITGDRVFLNCSHTHYGPVMARSFFDDENGRDGPTAPAVTSYFQTLPHTIAGAVAMADADRRPATLSLGRGAVSLGINRREMRRDGKIVLGHNPDGALDSAVLVWRFDVAQEPEVVPRAPPGWVQRAGKPIAVVVNYACHAVSLGSKMRWLTADFPGVMRSVVEQLVGGKALYIQGAAGNINPSIGIPAVQGRSEPDPWDAPRRLGHALGAEAARVALTARPAVGVPIRVARKMLDLPPLLPPTIGHARAAVTSLEKEGERLVAARENAGTKSWNQNRLRRAKQALSALRGGGCRYCPAGQIWGHCRSVRQPSLQVRRSCSVRLASQ